MQYSLTIFKSIYDNKTHKKMVFNDWSGVEKLLFDLYKQPGYKPKKDEKFKDGSPLISPAVYKENEKRRKSQRRKRTNKYVPASYLEKNEVVYSFSFILKKEYAKIKSKNPQKH